jgi:hypothetical protein
VGAGTMGWKRVPVGGESARWATRGQLKKVLLVIHNVTSATRLLDVVPLFRDDLRIQLLATWTQSSPFEDGVAELLARIGLPVLPWDQARETPVDLAVSASFGGQLDLIPGKLAVLSHGVGYNKRLREPGAGSREPGAGSREPGAGSREPVFGLSPEWLLVDGTPVADALVLSHPEQFERLKAACPQAAPTAVLGGDPCFDRMLAARPYRHRFRRALGVGEGQRLIVLNSTWNPQSLFGNGGAHDILPRLLERLAAELPADEYRVAAVLHPNIWHGHGTGQIRTWLDRACRSGLTLIDPLDGWRQALLAADAVIGDFGSVSYYAAALGLPVLLGAAPGEVLDPRSPVGAFTGRAPRLAPGAALRPQLEQLLSEHVPLAGPAELTTSVPGQAAALLRRLFYDLIAIPEPARAALLDPLPLPAYQPAAHTSPLRVLTRVLGPAQVAVTRYGDPPHEPAGEGGVHTTVHEDTLDPGLLDLADVIYRHGPATDHRLGSPAQWTAEVMARHAQCALAAYVIGPGSCTVRTRAGRLLVLDAATGAADPAAYASALLALLDESGPAREPDVLDALAATGLTVRTGTADHAVSLTPLR